MASITRARKISMKEELRTAREKNTHFYLLLCLYYVYLEGVPKTRACLKSPRLTDVTFRLLLKHEPSVQFVL